MKSLSQLRTRADGSTGGIVSLIVLLACITVAGLLFFNRQYVLDQLAVWQYQPSSEIQAIASNAQLNDHGRFYFYASQPEVNEAATFNTHCKKQEEHSAILGCYSSGRIFIYNVTDAQLKGIQEVTAAHEMLHAAWDRLSDSEQKRLKQLLTFAYDRVATPELEQRMAYYERAQPGEQTNELHSIVGTEFGELGDELEQYYSQYFADRQQVVSLHRQYQSIFDKLETKANVLAKEMRQLESSIQERLAAYDNARLRLEQEAKDLEAQSVDQSNAAAVGAYNARVNEFNSSLSALRADYSRITGLIKAYNQKVKEYNSVAVNLADLQRSIDSSQVSSPAI